MWKLALRNVFRHRARTAMTLAAITIGVMSLVLSGGLVQDFLIQLREATIHSQFGHLQLYKAGYSELGSRAPYRYMINDPAQTVVQLTPLQHVTAIAARVNFSGLLSNGRTNLPVIAEGIDAEKEREISKSTQIINGSNLSRNTPYAIIIGQGVAQALGLKPGGTATLLVNTREGALNSLDFEVAGIFQTFSKEYDERAIRVPLAAAQELLDTKAVHTLVVALDETAQTDAVGQKIMRILPRDEFEIRTWYELADFYSKAENLYKQYFTVLRLIILGMVLLGVANSVNITIHERTGEFGTLMALGNRRQLILRLVLTENLLVGLIGASAGVVLAIIAALAISAIGIPMPPMPDSNSGYTAGIRLIPSEIEISFMIGLLATCLAALLPAWRASRTSIVEALAQN